MHHLVTIASFGLSDRCPIALGSSTADYWNPPWAYSQSRNQSFKEAQSIIIWAKSLLLFVKNTINLVVSAIFLKKQKLRTQMFIGYYLGQVGHFLSCTKLGPDNNLHLAQVITYKMVSFWPFLAPKDVLKYLFYSADWTSTKLCPKMGPKTENFPILQTQV